MTTLLCQSIVRANSSGRAKFGVAGQLQLVHGLGVRDGRRNVFTSSADRSLQVSSTRNHVLHLALLRTSPDYVLPVPIKLLELSKVKVQTK